jgi:hypothetical protein
MNERTYQRMNETTLAVDREPLCLYTVVLISDVHWHYILWYHLVKYEKGHDVK